VGRDEHHQHGPPEADAALTASHGAVATTSRAGAPAPVVVYDGAGVEGRRGLVQRGRVGFVRTGFGATPAPAPHARQHCDLMKADVQSAVSARKVLHSEKASMQAGGGVTEEFGAELVSFDCACWNGACGSRQAGVGSVKSREWRGVRAAAGSGTAAAAETVSAAIAAATAPQASAAKQQRRNRQDQHTAPATAAAPGSGSTAGSSGSTGSGSGSGSTGSSGSIGSSGSTGSSGPTFPPPAEGAPAPAAADLGVARAI